MSGAPAVCLRVEVGGRWEQGGVEEEGCSGELPSPGSVVVFRRYYCSPASVLAAGGCSDKLKLSEEV